MTWEIHALDSIAAMKKGHLFGDHVITDPPYDLFTHAGARSVSSKGAVPIGIDFQFIEPRDIAALLVEAVPRWAIAFCSLEQLGKYQQVNALTYVRSAVWVRKTAPQVTGDRPAQGAEGIAIMHRQGRKKWNGGGKDGVYYHLPVRTGRYHPTPKPVGLCIQLIEDFTDPGDLILDPFCGSASIGEAALLTGRRYFGADINPKYCDIAKERLRAVEQGLTLKSFREGQLPLFRG